MLKTKILKTFPAFQERNFRLYYGGQFVSLCGTWLQTVAFGWLVLQITGSAFWVGFVASLTVLPTLIFSLIGGVIVDRFDKKKILYITQSLAMLIALSLGILTLLHLAKLWEICVLAAALGTVNAVDIPALQAFVSEMVDREHLASALALNSALQNAARTLGPAMAGVLVAVLGVGWTFILNGLSFTAVLFVFTIMNIRNQTGTHNKIHPIQMIKDGLSYTFSHAGIALCMWTFVVIGTFGYSYIAIMPVIVTQVFHRGADGLGYFLAAVGFGAMIAALIVSAYSKRLPARITVIGSTLLFGTMLLIFSFTRTFPIALVALVFSGFTFTFISSMINTLVQHEIDGNMRGRVMSILIMMFFGASFVGNLSIGYFASKFGPMPVISTNALVVIAWALVLWNKREVMLEMRRVGA